MSYNLLFFFLRKLTEKVLTKFFQTGPIKRVNLENIDLVEKLYNLNVTMAHLQQNIQTIKTDLMDYRKRFVRIFKNLYVQILSFVLFFLAKR